MEGESMLGQTAPPNPTPPPTTTLIVLGPDGFAADKKKALEARLLNKNLGMGLGDFQTKPGIHKRARIRF